MLRTNPATIKQWLDLQLTSNIGAFRTESPAGALSDSGFQDTDFAGLLEQLLGGSEDRGTGKVIPAAELLARGKLASSSFHFPALQAFSQASVPGEFGEMISETGRRYGVQPGLVKAVIQTESSFNPYAVSQAGAKGLMQLMDETAQGLGVTNPFDPKQNIDGGTRYLSGLLKKYNGNEAVALAAYNAGPGRIDRLGIRDDRDLQEKAHLLPQETRQYVAKVLEHKQSDSI